MRVLEKFSGHYARRVGTMPTAVDLVADVVAMATAQAKNPSHEVWRYSPSLQHPVVHEAATNALNDRWNRADPQTDSYDLFYPSEAEMIQMPPEGRTRRPRKDTGRVAVRVASGKPRRAVAMAH